MFKSFFKSTYVKAALTVMISGGVLILFHNWVKATHFQVGLDKLNDTLMPIYIGCFMSFIICPIYNRIVKLLYPAFRERLIERRKAQEIAGEKTSTRIKVRRIGSEPIEMDIFHRSSLGALRWARTIATVVCIVIIVGGLFLLGYFVIPQVVESIVTVIETMPQKLEALSEWSNVHLSNFPQVSSTLNNLANAGTVETTEWIQEHIFNSSINGQSITTIISQGFMSVLNAFMNFFIGILIAIYLLNYKERLFAIGRKLIASMTSENRARKIFEFTSIINDTFINFIVGRILDAIVIGLLTYIVLAIFRFNMPLLIAVIIGVTNVIPFFGPFIGAIPSFILLLMNNPIQALWFVLIIFIIQQLDGNIIGPSIVGTALGMPSFWVLISVLIGGGLFGFIGMFLGVPTFAVVYKYIDRGASKRLKRKEKAYSTVEYVNYEQFGIDAKEIYDELDNTDKQSNKQTDRQNKANS